MADKDDGGKKPAEPDRPLGKPLGDGVVKHREGSREPKEHRPAIDRPTRIREDAKD